MPRIHHINLVVPDLEVAAERFAKVLSMAPGAIELLPSRGVALRRFDLDGVWLVLLAPTRDDSPAATWLAAHGPGLFLLSFAADGLTEKLDALSRVGIAPHGGIRRGLDDWCVVDLDPAEFFGIPLQLTEHMSREAAEAMGEY